MRVLSRSTTINAPAGRVFAYVDDIRNLARHMSERGAVSMMGSKLTLEIVTPEPTGIGATYGYAGRVIGLTVDFSETVTRYIPGREKVWRTIGEPRLLLLESYKMRVLVEPDTDTRARLTITIDYALPRTGLWRLLGGLLAAPYARWCLGSMIEGTVQELAGGAT